MISKTLPMLEIQAVRPGATFDFDERLAVHGSELRAAVVETLQVNVENFAIRPVSIAM